MSERDLHVAIRQLLSAVGITYIESRMDRRTTQRKGVPDFLFAIRARPVVDWVFPCAWECKIGKGKLTAEQSQMFERLSRAPNHWRCKIIRTIDDAISELRDIGVKLL